MLLYVLIMDQITNRHGFLDVFMPVRSSGSRLIRHQSYRMLWVSTGMKGGGRFPILWAGA